VNQIDFPDAELEYDSAFDEVPFEDIEEIGYCYKAAPKAERKPNNFRSKKHQGHPTTSDKEYTEWQMDVIRGVEQARKRYGGRPLTVTEIAETVMRLAGIMEPKRDDPFDHRNVESCCPKCRRNFEQCSE
jgi:hypothetical protein